MTDDVLIPDQAGAPRLVTQFAGPEGSGDYRP